MNSFAVSAFLPLLLIGLLIASCAGTQTTSSPARTAATPARTTTVSASGGDPNSVPSIAQREVIRRQEMIRQMDEAAIKASQRMAEDDLEGAVEGYRRAIGQ